MGVAHAVVGVSKIITVVIAMINLQLVIFQICLLLSSVFALVSNAHQCPSVNSSNSPLMEAISVRQQDPGGLAPLLTVASSIREGLLGQNFDFDLLVEDINSM